MVGAAGREAFAITARVDVAIVGPRPAAAVILAPGYDLVAAAAVCRFVVAFILAAAVRSVVVRLSYAAEIVRSARLDLTVTATVRVVVVRLGSATPVVGSPREDCVLATGMGLVVIRPRPAASMVRSACHDLSQTASV